MLVKGGVQTRLRHCWFLSVGQRACVGRVGEGQRAEGKGLRVARMPRGPRCKLQRAKKRAWAHGTNPMRNHVAGPSGVHLQGLRFSALQFASITATAGRVLGRLTRRVYCLFVNTYYKHLISAHIRRNYTRNSLIPRPILGLSSDDVEEVLGDDGA